MLDMSSVKKIVRENHLHRSFQKNNDDNSKKTKGQKKIEKKTPRLCETKVIVQL